MLVAKGRRHESGGLRRFHALVITGALLSACTPSSTPPMPTPTVADPWLEHGPITLATSAEPQVWAGVVSSWNTLRPNEPVTLVNLPISANQRHAAITERSRANSGEYTVIELDLPWTVEFAAKGWLTELPPSRFPTDAMVPAAVASASWNETLYAYPTSVDAGVLYYRQDLLTAAGLEAPTSWPELESACAQVRTGSMSCLGLSLAKDEPLTVGFAEAVVGAGGQLLTSAGEPNVSSSAAVAGLEQLADWVDSGLVPEEALTWSEADAVREFAEGNLVFLRSWATASRVFDSADPSTAVVGKTGVTRLAGRLGVAPSVQGGHNLAISAFARNKGTAADFLAYVASEAMQRGLVEAGSQGPVLSALYTDAALVAQHPYLPVLDAALGVAVTRPTSPRYGEVTQTIQEQADAALRGQKTSDQALTELQSRLESILE